MSHSSDIAGSREHVGRMIVTGGGVDDEAVRAAVADAGYAVAS